MADTAAKFGYRSTFVVPHDGGNQCEKITLVPIRPLARAPGWTRRLIALIQLGWGALRSTEDLFQIHDPDLVPVGLLLKLFRRRVVYDVHDDYEATIRDRLRTRPRLARRLSKVWWWFEKNAARRFDGVVVADRHLAAKFADCDPVTLGNYPRLDFTGPSHVEDEPTFNLIYVGGVSRDRGVGVALEALRLVPIPELRLHVIGSGRDPGLLDELRSEPRVVLHGQVPWKELHRYYEKAHIGLALYQPLEGFLYCPGENAVKVIEYMAASIPVVCSNFPGLKAFVEDAGVGLTVQPDDPEAVADTIRLLVEDEGLRRSLGAEGRRRFEEEYHWEGHEGRLIEMYDRVLKA